MSPSPFAEIGFAVPDGAAANAAAIALRAGPAAEALLAALAAALPEVADPDMAFNNFERLIAAAPDVPALAELFRSDPRFLLGTLQLGAGSQFFAETLVSNPDWVDWLHARGAEPLDGAALAASLAAELANADEAAAQRLLRRTRRRELLRIGYRDIALGEPLEAVTREISDLADALLHAALEHAQRRVAARWGRPLRGDGQTAPLAALGMGKLGGRELNYSSDIDLIFVYDEDGATDRGTHDNSEFFAEAIGAAVRLLSKATADGFCFRIDLRLRPHGDQAQVCQGFAATVAYYEREGRTWERQAFVKARPVAGAKALGAKLLRRLETFVFRPYLKFVEINEIKALKRQIERRTASAGAEDTDLKTGRGGIRDVEFVVQFLQLLHGGRRPEVRSRNTLSGLRRLAKAGVLRPDERRRLESGYRFLRKAEHRLQFLHDLQQHRIAEGADELRKLAVRMGYPAAGDPERGFADDLRQATADNRALLERLLHDLFPAEPGSDPAALAEADLLFEPTPAPERIAAALRPHGFADPAAAYANLQRLGREELPFLSTPRCRHFLASIAPRLLRELAHAPAPDDALNNLEKVTASLGAKGALWESCASHPPLLRLYVQLCAWSQFLSELLINNPGMIDELLDTLALDRPSTAAELAADLAALLRNAADPAPILHAFRNGKLLAIGLADVLGRSDIQTALRRLSELAAALLGGVADRHWAELAAEHGSPALHNGAPARYALLGLGKFGGGELSYHSDLDLVLVYEGDGRTADPAGQASRGPTDNFVFFGELAQRIVRTLGAVGPLGRLYPIDLRLRPTGGSGALVSPRDAFRAYYRPGGEAQTWELQALTRARPVHGDPQFCAELQADARAALADFPWRAEHADEIAAMRHRLEASRPKGDLKRGVGGLADIEFAVQLAQLKHGRRHPGILQQNLWAALRAIGDAGLWGAPRVAAFLEGYTFLRRIESRVRIVTNFARDTLPENPDDLHKLAIRAGYDGPDGGARLRADLDRALASVRREFLATVAEERTPA